MPVIVLASRANAADIDADDSDAAELQSMPFPQHTACPPHSYSAALLGSSAQFYLLIGLSVFAI